MALKREVWGSFEGKTVYRWTMENPQGLKICFINLGNIITELHVPDANGTYADVVLGFDALEPYTVPHPYFGATVGRCANRIGRGEFNLNNKSYRLATNDGPNHLHGGEKGFFAKVWSCEEEVDAESSSVLMKYESPDGEEGYPGHVTAWTRYTLTPDHHLKISYKAKTDAPTIINLAHHGYFNLGGHASGTVLDHELKLYAEHYTPLDETFIPTGEISPVENTALNFLTKKTIGQDLDALPPKDKDNPGGFDFNFIVQGQSGTLRPVAEVKDPKSGRRFKLSATAEGVQFYSGNFLDGLEGKAGTKYGKHTGFCLETQNFPDAINKTHLDNWPSVILNPDQTYTHEMVFAFGW